MSGLAEWGESTWVVVVPPNKYLKKLTTLLPSTPPPSPCPFHFYIRTRPCIANGPYPDECLSQSDCPPPCLSSDGVCRQFVCLPGLVDVEYTDIYFRRICDHPPPKPKGKDRKSKEKAKKVKKKEKAFKAV